MIVVGKVKKRGNEKLPRLFGVVGGSKFCLVSEWGFMVKSCRSKK
ncbi:hypothetical protein RUMHYD_00341 [Blautia hydrogenotrophica DSM 10507]|uniref:Uncharacterized protein n=1 Tax=Blautia hydrogenotrophica (strain DSM 10507 / JCM 14656 / S5a33) TaxID=476272 RepID=C0CHM7_BLAHS|nr:hypothetical protein RUMHYD_00341 [Blautia hydrogenotrophica DSM 10507]